MTRSALVAMSAADTPEGRGRMNHVPHAAQSLMSSDSEVGLFFHGIGVTWLDAFDEREDQFTEHYGLLFDEVKSVIGGACDFCAAVRFEANGSAEKLGVPLLGGSGKHHDIGDLIGDGWTVTTF